MTTIYGHPDDCDVCQIAEGVPAPHPYAKRQASPGLAAGHPGEPGPAASYSGELHDSPDCSEFSPRADCFCCSPLHGTRFMKIPYPEQSISPYIENRFIANANLPEAGHGHDTDYWRARALNAEKRAETAETLRRIWRDTTISQKETAGRLRSELASLRFQLEGEKHSTVFTRFDLAVERANGMIQADTIKKLTAERDQAVGRAESAERMAIVWQDIARRWEKTSNGWRSLVLERLASYGRSTEAGTES